MNAAAPRVGLLGFGHAAPSTVRGNDDPIYDWIRENDPTHGQLFTGYVERRVLAPGEHIDASMIEAARFALADARLAPADIDMLLGFVSVSSYITPNALAAVHAALALRKSCWAMPVQADFSNFPAALLVADALVACGRARNVLVVCGSNWTRYVSYRTPQCVSAGDGAGAAVVGITRDTSRLRIVDYEVEVESSGYGNMFMQADPLDAPSTAVDPPLGAAYSQPYYHITAQGMSEYQVFGVETPPRLVARLLDRNAVPTSAASIVPYQASAKLIDAWTQAMRPLQMLHTLESRGNMVIANLAVNLAVFATQIESDHVVLVGLGPEPHASALLLRRGGG
jgi:3-oxoacyl-[acyl-carrier-protein] synthase III